ncbi:unnamed protein product [Ilex paraguariensis]|uniref:Beta-glucosidase 41 n=1 Tax=Ilex paraguariensis TaxID=185542 RepID=A0ABC8R5T8_9AQUA
MATILILFSVACLFMNTESISRADFPDGFIFGTASSAYQFEGAVNEGNKGTSIWDTFSKQPGRILDFSNAKTAVDQYHRFKSDIDLMKDLGMDAYRFSISWSRIFPNGTGEPNHAGIEYYNNLIDDLLEKGIQPYVTLYHWDLPQMLEDRYEGWLNDQIVKDFEHYAFICFKAFGDRVKYWLTFNEPHSIVLQGYDLGFQAPGRCSILGHLLCRKGQSSIEPYIVAHNILLSHAAAYHSYQHNFKKLVAERLPEIKPEVSSLLVGSLDFVGINHYTTLYARNDRTRIEKFILQDASSDAAANSHWLHIVPWGIRKLAKYVRDRYGNPPMVITENGMDDPNKPHIALNKALQDDKRIRYHRDYLSNLSAAIRQDNCDVRGYFVWSLLDNWEWNMGYSARFGLYYIDYRNNLTRIPKASAKWFRNMLRLDSDLRNQL